MTDDLREEIASLAHEQWAGWMTYVFEKGRINRDGTLTIPKWAVERWTRQMLTPYEDLTEEEKENDRKEADKFIAAIGPLRRNRDILDLSRSIEFNDGMDR